MGWPIRPLVPVLHDQGQSLDDHVRIDESLKVFPTLLIHQSKRIYCENGLKIIVFADDSLNVDIRGQILQSSLTSSAGDATSWWCRGSHFSGFA
jgi:hypothetical protein